MIFSSLARPADRVQGKEAGAERARRAARSIGFAATRDGALEPDSTTADIDWTSEERFLSLRRALGVTSFGLNQITLQPGQRGRIHRHHEQEEVYLVMRGTLTVAVEGQEHELGEAQLMRVPPEARRQLMNRGDRPCVVVAIGGAGEHVGRDGEAFADWSETEGRSPQELPLPEDLPTTQ